MSLPVGSWNISTDGLGAGTLAIGSVDASGNVAGSITIPSAGPIVGFFDATSQTVNLSNVTDPAQLFYVFSGALFQATSGSLKTQTTTDSVLAGTYEAYPAGAAAAATGRWTASLNQKVKEKDKEEKEKEQAKDSKDQKDIKDRKEIKEGTKEIKEAAIEKLPELSQSAVVADPSSFLQQLTLRVDAIEQRLATGQAFIPVAERPDVGGQALRKDAEE